MRTKSVASKFILIVLVIVAEIAFLGAGQPSVNVAPMDKVGPRPVEEQTRKSVIRDYLQAWQGLSGAFDQNDADSLDQYFVGVAKQKLAATIHEQEKAEIHTSYQDRSHNIQVIFYSPEGLSLQLTDDVEYQMEVRSHDRVVGTQEVHARYVAVLTPTESKWKVRVFQAGASQ